MEYPQFVGGSYVAQTPNAANAFTMNWYVERVGLPGATTPQVLVPTPGVTRLETATSSPGRGRLTYKGRAFAVIGTQFGEIAKNGTFTVIGTVAIDTNPATICTNGDGGGQLFVTSGDHGYIYDLTAATFTEVRTSATTMGAHLDGYFIALDVATSTIFLSALLDGTIWDPTQYAQRSIRPDPWVSMIVHDRYLWLHGQETSDVWYNQGTFPFPFAPHPSGLMPYGCAAPFSPQVVDGAVMWLAQTAQGSGDVVRASGFVPEVVSTPALQAQLADLTLSDAIGDTYEDLGHSFYVLTLPTAGLTPVYDTSTQLWCDRGTWVPAQMRFTAWRPLYHLFAFDKHLMLDRQTGDIWHLSATIHTDVDGSAVRRVRRAPDLWRENARLTVPRFEVYLEPGLGLTSGQGSDPQVSLRISPNHGKTWRAERLRSAGARGHYDTRVRWLRNGSGRSWQPEIVATDPIPWRITGAGVEVSVTR